ncbi:tetratricopeptide repeat protein [Sediminicola luteus]|nr:tetratricopeptide repeat protein [Sediminicola luteus]
MRFFFFGFLCFPIVLMGQQSLKIADSLFLIEDYYGALTYYQKDGSLQAQQQMALAYERIDEPKKAISAYEHVIGKDSYRIKARYALGKLYLKQKQPQKAISTFEALVQDRPNQPNFNYYLAKSLLLSPAKERAEGYFLKTLNLQPKHFRASQSLAKWYLEQKNADAALAVADAALAYRPNDKVLVNFKALALYEKERYEDAIPVFQHLMALGESKSYIFHKLASCQIKSFEYADAIATYQLMHTVLGPTFETLKNIGQLYEREHFPDSAIYYTREAILFKTYTFEEEYGFIGMVQRERGQMQQALKSFQKAHEENPKDDMAFYNICTLGDQLYADKTLALKKYRQFLSLYPNSHPYMRKTVRKRIKVLDTIHTKTP